MTLRSLLIGVVNHAPGGAGVGGGLVAIHMVYSKAHKRQEAMEVLGWWRSDPVETDGGAVKKRLLLTTGGEEDDRTGKQSGEEEGAGGGGAGETVADVSSLGAPRRSLLRLAGSDPGTGGSDTCPVPEPPAEEHETSPANRGVLFTHTYFRQMEDGGRAFICAGKTSPGSCPCCQALPDKSGDAGGWVEAVATGVSLGFNTPDDHVHPLDPQQNREVLRKAPGCGMSVDGGWNEFWDR